MADWWDKFIESLGDRYTGTQKLFLRKDNSKIINPGTILYWLHKAEDECGLPRATVHSLRHSNISMQLISGLSDKQVSIRAGHANTKVTKDIYWEIFKEDDIDTASAIDSIFGL